MKESEKALHVIETNGYGVAKEQRAVINLAKEADAIDPTQWESRAALNSLIEKVFSMKDGTVYKLVTEFTQLRNAENTLRQDMDGARARINRATWAKNKLSQTIVLDHIEPDITKFVQASYSDVNKQHRDFQAIRNRIESCVGVVEAEEQRIIAAEREAARIKKEKERKEREAQRKREQEEYEERRSRRHGSSSSSDFGIGFGTGYLSGSSSSHHSSSSSSSSGFGGGSFGGFDGGGGFGGGSFGGW